MITYITSETLNEKTEQWMRAISPFNLHDWRPDPDKSALLVIDCQCYFVGGHDSEGAPILKPIRNLIDAFRKAKRPVIFTRHMHKEDGSDSGMLGEWWGDLIYEGTDESEVHGSLDVGPEDIVIQKNRYNAFQDTGLDDLLKQYGVRDVVFTGVMTNLCCETTAREAFCRDYRVFFTADATGTSCEEMHVASLINIGYGFGTVIRSADVISCF